MSVDDLSPRERQVLQLVGGEGAQYKTVSKALGISTSTVRAYVSNILRKKGVDRAGREGVVVVYYMTQATQAAAADRDSNA